jgi:hypothetical protein
MQLNSKFITEARIKGFPLMNSNGSAGVKARVTALYKAA